MVERVLRFNQTISRIQLWLLWGETTWRRQTCTIPEYIYTPNKSMPHKWLVDERYSFSRRFGFCNIYIYIYIPMVISNFLVFLNHWHFIFHCLFYNSKQQQYQKNTKGSSSSLGELWSIRCRHTSYIYIYIYIHVESKKFYFIGPL